MKEREIKMMMSREQKTCYCNNQEEVDKVYESAELLKLDTRELTLVLMSTKETSFVVNFPTNIRAFGNCKIESFNCKLDAYDCTTAICHIDRMHLRPTECIELNENINLYDLAKVTVVID